MVDLELDKDLIAKRFGASFDAYDRLADVQRRICERLAELVVGVCESPVRTLRENTQNLLRVLEIGAGTGFLTRQLAALWPQAHYYINDLSPASQRFTELLLDNPNYIWGDAETLDYPHNLDLLATASTVQWFADMSAFAAKAAAALRPNGVLAVATFGPQNFHELKKASGAGLDYLDRAQLEEIFKGAGFEITHSEEWLETLEFESPRHVLKYVKMLGLNALDTPRPSAFSIARAYQAPATLTYHPIIVVATAHTT